MKSSAPKCVPKQCLAAEERTYNSRQLAVKLAEERQVKLSGDRIRKLLKKRAITGNAPGTAIEVDKTLRPKRKLPPS